METKHLQHLRRVGVLEGISFVLLMGIAMPLKYMYDMPMAVKIVGWAHGVLFVWYCLVLLLAHQERSWSLLKTGSLFMASVLPFGPFIAEKWLGEEFRNSQASVDE